RQSFADKNPNTVAALIRALHRAARFIEEGDRREVASILARPDRVGVDAEVISRTLEGRLKISPDGAIRENPHYLLTGEERPDSTQAAWLYAQMVRWGQAPISDALLDAAKATYRADLYDAALPLRERGRASPAALIGAFAGPEFDDRDIGSYLSAFSIGRRR
ncbi:MAG: nitrate transporter, partial [Sphingopyxis terrae]